MFCRLGLTYQVYYIRRVLYPFFEKMPVWQPIFSQKPDNRT